MAENQKDSVKKSFWQRNLFLIIILLIIIVAGGGYLYKNNILKFSFSSQSPTPSPVEKRNYH
jgi:predicted negative regulator of RcsB-dependent stress response